ncbi:protein-glutamate O-methyltransferase CheR [Dehalococcoidia bacterium]|nr:protein-glutamate O-methyltransferase CheR [Dehalococcoidia bacterium]
MITDTEYTYVKKRVRDLVNIDLENYKEKQMRRRLSSFLERCNAPDAASYFGAAERDQGMLRELADFLTINVSEFFRDERHFERLEKLVLPELLKKNPHLNIWSAGCSNGAEPYTIAIILAELSPGRPHRILATDIDNTILACARVGGPYAAQDVRNIQRDRLARYFTKSGDKYWVVDRIKERVVFKQHNLLSDPYEHNFDLIVCRNVVIYFTDEAKRKINRGFCRSLKDNGILFVGGSEVIMNAAELGLESIMPSLYRKSNGAKG